MARFRDIKILQKFTSSHAAIHKHFNQERDVISSDIYKPNRSVALAEWRLLAA